MFSYAANGMQKISAKQKMDALFTEGHIESPDESLFSLSK